MKTNGKKIVFAVGCIALILGAIDPLEGSVVILIGSLLIFLSTFLGRDSYRKLFLIAFIMIVWGIFFMFLLSWMGGFGGEDNLPWALALMILPYPAGWIMSLVVLIVRAVKNRHRPHP